MRKPMVFFQYDEEGFRQGHYKQGYFDYRRDGFGDVVETEDDVIDSIKHILQNDLKPDQVYLDRMNSFFKFDDAENSRRNFEEICKL